MPFYRTLADSPLRRRGAFRLIAASGEDVTTTGDYLKRNGIAVDQVVMAASTSGKIRATPTIVLVNNAALVQSSWRGQLPQARERDVLQALESN